MNDDAENKKSRAGKAPLFFIIAAIALILPVSSLVGEIMAASDARYASTDDAETAAQTTGRYVSGQTTRQSADKNASAQTTTQKAWLSAGEDVSAQSAGRYVSGQTTRQSTGQGVSAQSAGGNVSSQATTQTTGRYASAQTETTSARNRRTDRSADPGSTPDDINPAPGETEAEPALIDTAPENVTITISAIGDCTIGYDDTFGYGGRFDAVYAAAGGDPAYFFENVRDIFAGDDLTVANLESVFTNSSKKASKTYRFKGPPEYVRILEEGNVDIVNIANNHMYDFLQRGFDDTVKTLADSKVQYFGYDVYGVVEIKGVRIGLAGFHIGGGGWSGKKKDVTKALEYLRSEADLVIMSFHWGIEGHYKPSGDQRSLAKYCIDNGADLVLGHHPHTLQSVETYKDRTIAYSLGNFCFGGNRNPKDKDSIILRQAFEFDPGDFSLVKALEPDIIPVSISSVPNKNDYRPTPVTGDAAARTLKKVLG